VTNDQSHETEGALSVLARGLRASPDLKRGLVVTALMGLSATIGKLIIPILIQQVLDHGILPDGDVNSGLVTRIAVVGTATVLATSAVTWIAQRRLVTRAETAIAEMRVGAFAKVHQLSIADHNETRRGVLVARVTSDADALAKFAQWGLYAWTVYPVLIIGTIVAIAYYSWPLALIVTMAYVPVIPWFQWLQRRQLRAYDLLRTQVAEMLGRFSEAVAGAAVVRAYGLEGRTRRRLHHSIDQRYKARMRANVYMSGVFVTGDILGAIAMVAVLIVGVTWRQTLGLDSGELVAVLVMTTLLQGPIGELGETLDNTQTAVAGWRKILDLLDRDIDVVEPVNGLSLPEGPLEVEVNQVDFAYRDGAKVLEQVSIRLPAARAIAVVGETGSGKSTFAKLLCRLADPTSGEIKIGGVDLAEVSAESRHSRLRMVPQDGFLFDTSIAENVRYGRPGSTLDDVEEAFTDLGLMWWVDALPAGLDTRVGERGENLSVGERQLVALARAALADPGLLVLDEATSAVDPQTDRALGTALEILAKGRTTVSVAHRLSTAEGADLVLVFDRGRLAEVGRHSDLVDKGGIYSRLHQAWLGNTGQGGSVATSSR